MKSRFLKLIAAVPALLGNAAHVVGLGRTDTLEACNIGEGRHLDGRVTLTLEATATRYLVAKHGSAFGKVDLSDGTQRPIGVIEDEGVSGGIVSVRLFSARGTALIQAAGAISLNDLVEATTGGQVTTSAFTTTGTHWVVGRAMNAATNAGDLVEVDLFFNYIKV